MKRYKVISGYCHAVGQDVYPGDEVTFASPAAAAIEVRNGRVVEIPEEIAEEEAGDAPASDPEAPEGEPTTERRRRRS